MNSKITSNLIDNLSKDLLKNGYCIFDIENQVSLELFYRNIQKELNQNEIVRNFGEFKPDEVSVEDLGKNNSMAIRMMKEAGWD